MELFPWRITTLQYEIMNLLQIKTSHVHVYLSAVPVDDLVVFARMICDDNQIIPLRLLKWSED